jgi:deferrochelatase/peroxidase EfeB
MAAAGADLGLRAARGAIPSIKDGDAPPATQPAPDAIEPFYGRQQGGILTPLQKHTYFAAFDLLTASRDDVVRVLHDWTSATARMSGGKTAMQLNDDPAAPPADSGETLGLPAARLTVTFGFGPGLFIKDGKDRYGLSPRRPQAMVDLPRFNGDQLVEAQTGGDLSVQACADDPQVAFHAVRQLARLADGVAQVRWAQTGFLPNFAPGQTPRNLMGFKDGTSNPSDTETTEKFVWVGDEGPDWMRGGSYLVVRRIRMALEHWDRMKLDFQEQTIGRHKYSGAPLGARNELDPVNLDATDADGNSVIPDNAHLRLANAASNDGARILRRPYSFNDGVNFTSERWPPWRQGMEYDAGLLFICYQRDPRTGFIKIFDRMSKLDMLNQFVTHTGGGLFACPGGVMEGEFIGQRLFQAS